MAGSVALGSAKRWVREAVVGQLRGNQQWQPSAWEAHVRKEPRRCFYCWENSYVGYQKCTNKDCPLNTNNWDWWKGDGQEHSVSASAEAAAGSDSAGGA